MTAATAPGWALTVTEREEGKTEPDTLAEAVQQTLGGASVCWSEMGPGVFESEKALALGDQLMEWINRHYAPRSTPRGAKVKIRNAFHVVDRWANGEVGHVKGPDILQPESMIIVHLATGHDIKVHRLGVELAQ